MAIRGKETGTACLQHGWEFDEAQPARRLHDLLKNDWGAPNRACDGRLSEERRLSMTFALAYSRAVAVQI